MKLQSPLRNSKQQLSAAFIGPFVSDIFGSSTVKLGVNAVLAGTAGLVTLLLPGIQFCYIII